ncbi:hypothetical protein ADK86_36975 [Streptomyces sp. NRRL F-5755]|nr:hypothetical protein ADK86_36975 [Streptomyces sp. NRRL F-5755]
MIRPWRAFIILSVARFATRKAAFRLVSRIASKSYSLIGTRRPSRVTPAFATRTSMGPCASSICLNASSTWAGSVTLHRTPT